MLKHILMLGTNVSLLILVSVDDDQKQFSLTSKKSAKIEKKSVPTQTHGLWQGILPV